MKGKITLGVLGFVLFFKKKSLFDEKHHSFSLEQRSIMTFLLQLACIFSLVPRVDCWEHGNRVLIQRDALELLLFDKNFKKCFGRGHFLDRLSASRVFHLLPALVLNLRFLSV